MNGETYLTLEEVATELRESVETVRGLCVRHELGRQGGLPSYHFGQIPHGESKRRLRKVLRYDLDAFIQSRRAVQVVIESPPPRRIYGRRLRPIV